MKKIPWLLSVQSRSLLTAEPAQSLAEPVDPAAPVEAEASAAAAIIDILRQRIVKVETAT